MKAAIQFFCNVKLEAFTKRMRDAQAPIF